MEPVNKIQDTSNSDCLKLTLSLSFIIFLCIFSAGFTAQNFNSKPTTAQDRWESFDKRKSMDNNSLFQNMPFRCVGPVVMSGRVVDIEPSPIDPYTFYVAYATGGLWKTENNGMRFNCIFENNNAIAIGDFAVDSHDPKTIWVWHRRMQCSEKPLFWYRNIQNHR